MVFGSKGERRCVCVLASVGMRGTAGNNGIAKICPIVF